MVVLSQEMLFRGKKKLSAQELEASVITAQCSHHGELQMEQGLVLKSQHSFLVLSCSSLMLPQNTFLQGSG